MEQESKFRKMMPWFPTFLAVIIIICGSIFTYSNYRKSSNMSEVDDKKDAWEMRGTVGDFFGGHLAAVSGLAAFLLMFSAILFQNKELKLQREELKESREIFREQKKIQDKQVGITENYYNREYILSVVKSLREVYFKVEDLKDMYSRRHKNARVAYFQLLDDLSIYLKNVESPEQYYGLIKAGFIPRFIEEFNENNNDENFPNADELIKKVGEPKEFTMPERQ